MRPIQQMHSGEKLNILRIMGDDVGMGNIGAADRRRQHPTLNEFLIRDCM
jgi:hypothetical protein